MLIEFLPLLASISVYGIAGIVSLFACFKTRRTGFVFVGIGFLTGMLPDMIRLALGGPFLALRLLEMGWSTAEIGRFMAMLGLVDLLMIIVFAVLVVIGLFLFLRDFQTRQ